MIKSKSVVFVLSLLIISANGIFAQSGPAAFTARPFDLSLYARDDLDSAVVDINGIVQTPAFDSIAVTILQDEVFYQRQSMPLVYSDGAAPFTLNPRIHAGRYEYRFTVDLIGQDQDQQILQADSVVCGDVYILSGQSNAHYAWDDAVYQNEFCRTFGVKTESSNYYPYLPEDTLWALSQGSSSLGPAVGTLGLYIQKMILENTGMPTCLINGGTGGSIIEEHLPDPADRLDLNTIYGKLLYRVRKAGIKRVRAIIWHQGENDSYVDKSAAYAGRFGELYNAWQSDFGPEKVYVFQIRPGCGGNAQSRFREVQRTLPEALDETDIVLMSTAGIAGHDGCHYSHQGYRIMAAWIYRVIAAELYYSNDTVGIYPPNISRISYDPGKQELQLIFDQAADLVWPADTLEQSLKDYFYLDGTYGMIATGRANQDSVILKLTGPQFVDHVTYLPDILYNTVNNTYEGPWLKNSRGVGALSFDEFPVENPSAIVRVLTPDGGELWAPNSEQNITWEHSDLSLLKIEFSADNGARWSLLAENVPAGQGSYLWQTPDTVATECRIRISDMDNATIADESNGVFGIFAKVLTLVSPAGGEAWQVGSTHQIIWNSLFIDQVRIQYTSDNESSWKTVKRITPAADGQVDWVVPNDISDQCRVKIIDIADADVFAVSGSMFSIVPATRIEQSFSDRPDHFRLRQNYPNPFNPSTNIDFQLPVSSHVKIRIFDVNGREIAILVDGQMHPGNYTVTFDTDKYNLSSGTFFYELEADGYHAVRKMQFTK